MSGEQLSCASLGFVFSLGFYSSVSPFFIIIIFKLLSLFLSLPMIFTFIPISPHPNVGRGVSKLLHGM